jgi:hypothetical protein
MAMPVWVGSGLLSEPIYDWQRGLRIIAAGAAPSFFDPSMSGYANWHYYAAYLIKNKIQDQVMCGHSNWGYFMTKVAQMIEPHGLRCHICMIDRTAKACPKLGANVKHALDLWAGPPMKTLRPSQAFIDAKNVYELGTYFPESHLSIINNREVQRRAIDFCNKWKRK